MKRWVCAVLLLTLAAAPLAAADLKADLLGRERALWKAWGEKKGELFRAQATEDYVQAVAGVGMKAGRDAVVKEIEGHSCVMSSFEFSDAMLRQPAPDVAILSYVATQDTKCDGQALPAKVFATSIWVRQGAEWRAYSYQETPIH